MDARAAVRYLRQQRGLSATALSQRAGLSPAYVGRLERAGIEDMPLRCFARLALAVGMNPLEVWVVVVAEAQRPTTAASPVAVTPLVHNGTGG